VRRSDVGPRVTHVLGIVVANLRGASYWVLLLVYVPLETLYWVLLLVYVGPRATLYWVLLVMSRLRQHTLLAIVVGL
jgi:hypothetical protein